VAVFARHLRPGALGTRLSARWRLPLVLPEGVGSWCRWGGLQAAVEAIGDRVAERNRGLRKYTTQR
jgi:hypothetical protein